MPQALWRVAGASVAGVSHTKIGLPCQDAHSYRLLPNGLLIAGVADGAGSASLAEVGAQIAVGAGVAALAHAAGETASGDIRRIDEVMLRDALLSAQSALEAEALRRNAPLRELATTLLLAVAAVNGIVAAQVGDGAIVGMDAAGALFPVTVPPETEYANATTFLTSPNALETAQFARFAQKVGVVALFSDGLQRLALKLPEGAPHAPFFTPLFRFIRELPTEAIEAGEGSRQLETFLRSPRITERADDDLTLLLAAILA